MQLETEARAIEAFKRHPRVLRLECGIQHYDWGDPDAIPAILGCPNPQRQPFAELWVGAHPDLPSQALIDGVRVPLDQLMREAPREILGPALAAELHGELPFLLKILAAANPLSIQVHPNLAQAVLGFERENLQGLPLNAATRNYRDPHHKPELLVALSEFCALHGFRPLPEIEQTLEEMPELSPLVESRLTNARDLAELYERLMRLDQSRVNALLGRLIERLEREDREVAFSPEEPAYWMLKAHRAFSTPGHLDRGLFSILLLNLVRLDPGQAIFVPAGELHAYLHGLGIEIMASSNNVLRGGLTTKHVDPGELLQVLRFQGDAAEVLEPQARSDEPRLIEYRTPAAEFALSRLALERGHAHLLQAGEMRLALVIEGPADVTDEGPSTLQIPQGGALLVPAGLSCRISAAKDAKLWIAQVPEGV